MLKNHMRKLMLSIGDKAWRELRKEAQFRDISIQELIRSVIIPLLLKSKK